MVTPHVSAPYSDRHPPKDHTHATGSTQGGQLDHTAAIWSDIDGGTTGQYYHLTLAEYNAISAEGTNSVTSSAVLADNVILRGDGTSRGAQISGISIDDSDNVSGANNVTAATWYSTGTVYSETGIRAAGQTRGATILADTSLKSSGDGTVLDDFVVGGQLIVGHNKIETASTVADDMIIGSMSDQYVGMTILTQSVAGQGNIFFADGTTSGPNTRAGFTYYHGGQVDSSLNDTLFLKVAGSTKWRSNTFGGTISDRTVLEPNVSNNGTMGPSGGANNDMWFESGTAHKLWMKCSDGTWRSATLS